MVVVKNVSKFMILAACVVLIPACWPGKKKDEAGAASGKNLYVLNVLDQDQYEECHIPGSLNVPFEKVEEFAQNLEKDAEVVLYCSNYQCTASSAAAKKLQDLGFTNVYAYEGGIAEWYQAGYPVEGECSERNPGADSCLLKVVEAPVAEHDASEVPVLSAELLKEKMVTAGLMLSDVLPVCQEQCVMDLASCESKQECSEENVAA